ncbi:hypothetical protein D0817_17090 [Flavobacterium cupreum]|uniref:Uncharacterized protein n=1 Tax=Flavobacterium cupreum TaxID=2133766 RepID=A0A434A493_9FLAO|nr:hypothetical protein D0817_17090 [Flavobacterium cupreum]
MFKKPLSSFETLTTAFFFDFDGGITLRPSTSLRETKITLKKSTHKKNATLRPHFQHTGN